MSAIKLFFCFAAALVFFSGVDTFYTHSEGVKFTCVQVCEGQLRGKTFTCDLHSPQGQVTAVVRMVIELNWRFYIIPKIAPETLFCERIQSADHYFINGTSRCPTSLRSAKTSPVDPSDVQSARRAEGLKNLLKELNEDSTDVLTSLEKSSSKSGLRSFSQAIPEPKKIEIKLVLEKLVEHLSIVGWLNEDVKFHESSGTHSHRPTPSKYPSRPNSSKYPSRPIQSKYPSQPSHSKYPSQPSLSKYPKSPSYFGQYNGFRNSGFPGFSTYPSLSSQKVRPPKNNNNNKPFNPYQYDYKPEFDHNAYSHFDHNTLYDAQNYDYNIKVDTHNIFNMNNDDMYGNGKHPGTNQYPHLGKGKHFTYPMGFGKGKRAEEGEEDKKEVKADEVKELASQIKEESSELLKELENGTLPDSSQKKRKSLTRLVRQLTGFMSMMDVNETNDYERVKIQVNNGLRAETNDDLDDSEPDEEQTALEEKPESKLRKFTHDTSDEQGECILCSIVLKDVCNDGKIVVCDETICCWMTFNPYYCMTTLNDKSAVNCYNSLFNILQSSKMLKA